MSDDYEKRLEEARRELRELRNGRATDAALLRQNGEYRPRMVAVRETYTGAVTFVRDDQ